MDGIKLSVAQDVEIISLHSASLSLVLVVLNYNKSEQQHLLVKQK